MNTKEVFCFIPAKSTSQRLKNKNIKLLNGQPMINYSILAAKQSKIFFDNIYVSTENKEYATIAKKAGAKVPNLRPERLAHDPFGIKEVAIDFIKTNPLLLQFKNIVIISPTCPLISPNDIIEAYNLFKLNRAHTLISVTETDHNAYRSVLIKDDLMTPIFDNYIQKKKPRIDPNL